MLFRDAVRDFLDENEYKGNSPATITYYQHRLDRFERDTGAVDLADFNDRAIRRWLMGHKDVSRNTLANYDRALRVFARWLHHRGYVTENPMRQLPKPKEVPTKITTFSQAEVKAMLEKATGNRNPLRDRALVTLLLDTGVRIGEATSLRLHDVQWQEGWLNLRGKTGERSVPFGRKTKLALRRYVDRERVASYPQVDRVFLTEEGEPLVSTVATRHVIRLARCANLTRSKVGPHTFRHTFAVEFIRAGGDAFTLQQLLGHITLNMTRKYVHLAKTDLRAAHKRFSPGDQML